MTWVLGGCNAATFRRLYDKVKHLKNCIFYTDDWNAFAKILPPKRHVIGKAHAISIEHDNSNTRHHLGRFPLRTKVVSQLEISPCAFGTQSQLPALSLYSKKWHYLYFNQHSPIFCDCIYSSKIAVTFSNQL